MGCETGEYLESDEHTPYATAQTGCLPSKKISWTYRAGDSLPLGQSRPGANVTLFLDFDGGSYSGVSSGKVSSSYDSSKRAAIEKTVEQMAGNYSRWSINVTTDKKVFESAKKRARIFVATSQGSSGMASTNGISSSSGYTGYVGVNAVLRPGSAEKCAYVPTHEFGHNFRLRGTTVDYADLYPNATIGAFMGGRDSQFKGYEWIALDSKEGWQDPVKIIGSIAGFAEAGGSSGDGGSCHIVAIYHSDFCTSSCPCNEGEGDCDRDSQCAPGLVCEERGKVDVCVKSAGSGGVASCNLPVVNRGNGGTGYGECQGDCDRDSDCQSGLVCVQLNTGDSVPGCNGRSSDNFDYCVKPMCM
jgi:hypothetical protein